MNTAQRNTRTLLEDLDRNHFHRAVLPVQLLTQASNRGRVEQGAYRKVGIQAGVDRGDHPHRRQRIPTEVEERVVDPDPLQPEHLGVDAGQESPRPALAGAR